MADDPTPTPVAGDPPVDPPADPPNGDGGEPADNEKLLAALRSERAKLREAEKRLKGVEDAKKSELERATERATAAEQRAADLERGLMRAKVAAKHQLPADLADRLKGDDEAAMEADAKQLAKLIRPAGDLGGRAGGTGLPGGGSAQPDDMNSRIRAAAGRLPV